MKTLFYFVLSFISVQILNAQAITPKVISTSGAFYQNSQMSISQTVGEMTMVKTFFNNSILTQGFQQSEKSVATSTKNIGDEKVVIRLYPLPAKDYVVVEIKSEFNFKAQLGIQGLNGQFIGKFSLPNIAKGSNQFKLDISELPSGTYSLALEPESIEDSTSRIIKQFIVER